MKPDDSVTVFADSFLVASSETVPVVAIAFRTLRHVVEGQPMKPETCFQIAMTKDKARELMEVIAEHLSGKAQPGAIKLN